jgi:hypothetical protein
VSLAAACVLVGSVLAAGGAGAQASAPTVASVSGGLGKPTVATTSFDLADVGYEQLEFTLSGTATAYTSAAPLTSDGKWTVTPGETAPYTTRIVVYRPEKAKDFNGTVVAEWLNVSGGADAGPDWTLTHNQMIRDGMVWVGVSAQAVGLNATKSADAARYAAVTTHPGDSFSYDMYTQAGQAIRDDAKTVLGGLKPKRVLAMGESQSAGRMVTYIDAVQPIAKVYDGFLVHSRGAGGSPLAQAPQAAVPVPSPTPIRDDLDVPVLVFQTETDVAGSNLASRQDDTKRFRLWEVAGTSHYDTYGIAIGPADTGDGQGAVQTLEAMQHPAASPSSNFTCDLPINTGPMHWVLDSAIDWLDRWVTNGTPPPKADRLQTTGVSPATYAADANGNALGGVRSPQVDAPVAALGGLKNGGTGQVGLFCRLFGTTVPFTAEQLATLYPAHKTFVKQWNQAADRAVKAGYLTEADAKELKAAAERSDIGKQP